MQWFHIAMLAGSENAEIDQSHEILVELAPAIVEKVVIPFLIGLFLKLSSNFGDFSAFQTKIIFQKPYYRYRKRGMGSNVSSTNSSSHNILFTF